MVLAWNIVGVLLLGNIIVVAILGTPLGQRQASNSEPAAEKAATRRAGRA